MGIHESQSLSFEMQLGRHPGFIAHLAPMIRQAFGDQPAFAPDKLMRLVTRVRPGLIRVDADELTYAAHVMLRYQGNAVGTVWASAINIGSAHAFKVRVVGEKGSLEWWDEQPNQLKVAFIGKPEMTYERGHGYLDASARFERVGGGHPSGYFDAWANLYRRFALAMSPEPQAKELLAGQWFPSGQDGVEGVRFVERCVASADQGSAWVDFA
jgi:predicted dehydrogenase